MSKRKLLLADDSITIQKVVNLTFADEGIEVISVGDGDSAMRKFDEFMPDLVMADVNMPGLSGYEVCRIIKRTDETRDIPVILLVGSFEPFDEAEAKDAGADDYLTKPFQSIRQLVNKVTDLLNQRERSATDAAYTENPPPSVVDTFAETLEFEKQPDASPTPEFQEIGSEFGDAGMDDEMIETSPANDYLSTSESESADQSDAEIDSGKTQPLSSEDLKGFDIVPGATPEQETPAAYENLEPVTERTEAAPERAEAASFDEEARKLDYVSNYEEQPEPEDREEVISETEPEIDYYLPEGGEEDKAEFEQQVTDAETLEPEIEYAPQEPREADFSQAPVEEWSEAPVQETTEAPFAESTDASVDESSATESTPYAFNENEYTGYTETETAEESGAETAVEAEATPEADFEEAAQTGAVEDYETAETPQIESDVDEAAEINAAPEAEAVTETPFSASVPAFANFDDGDLLELPPLVEETGIRPPPKAPPVVAEPEPVEESSAEQEPETAETATTAPEDSPAQSQFAASFPPELIEAIAQKVAEQISAKTMNDVLPQITELVMKKMAEEKSDEKN